MNKEMTHNNGTITTHEDGYALDSHSYSLNNVDIAFTVMLSVLKCSEGLIVTLNFILITYPI